MLLDAWANCLKRHLGHIAAIENHMRIAHRYTGHPWVEASGPPPCLSSEEGLAGSVDNRRFARCGRRDNNRDVGSGEKGRAHINPHQGATDSCALHLKRENASPGFDRDSTLGSVATGHHEVGDTSHAIATHLRLAAIDIEHLHTGRSMRRGQHQHQPISTNTAMPVGDPDGKPSGVWRHRLIEAVDVDVVVASSVHLDEVCSQIIHA